MHNQLHRWRLSSTPQEWKTLAERAGTSPGYLNLIAYGHRLPSAKMAEAIEKASASFRNKPILNKKSLAFGE